jgi:hypothetical protein
MLSEMTKAMPPQIQRSSCRSSWNRPRCRTARDRRPGAEGARHRLRRSGPDLHQQFAKQSAAFDAESRRLVADATVKEKVNDANLEVLDVLLTHDQALDRRARNPRGSARMCSHAESW